MTIMDEPLPDGWAWEPLSKNYRITKRPRALALSAHESIPFVPMDGIPAGGRRTLQFEWRSPSAIASGMYFERGDVLLSKITPSFENGKQGLTSGLPDAFGLASTEVIPLQPVSEQAVSLFLFYYLLHPDVRATLVARMEGSTGRQRVPEAAVRDLSVPTPPKNEQQRIAAMLLKVQRSIEIEDKLLTTVGELKQAAMHELFTRGLRGEAQKETEIGPLPESWGIAPLRSMARVIAGGTPSRNEARYWKAGTIPWVKTGEIDYRMVMDTEEKITPEGLAESAAKLLPKDTVLVAMYGQGITRGRVALLGIEAATNQACVGLIPLDGELYPRFLYYYLVHSYERLRSLSHGAQQQNLNAELIGSFPLPLPQPAEQLEIASILGAIDERISVHERKRAVLQDLFKTLLHELMSGRIRVADLDIDVSEVTAA